MQHVHCFMLLLSKRCILAAGGAHALSVSLTCWLLACGVSSFGALLHQDNMLRSWLQVTSRLQVRRSKRAGVRETVALLASFSDGQPDKEETGANQVQKAATDSCAILAEGYMHGWILPTAHGRTTASQVQEQVPLVRL
jgi:hypothetical protein